MNEEQALKEIKGVLKERRYEHTLRVVDEAERLALQYGADVSKARLAAILHDYAKYRSSDEMRETVRSNLDEFPEKLLYYGNEILHAFVGAYYVRKELHVTDEQILSAIAFHTTGKKEMELLEKVVFLADYIEPGRTFASVNEVRKTAESDLDLACFYAIKNTIQFLVEKNVLVYPDTFEAYNDFANKISGRS
ncbi:bis(5'-nucleosyl)-tetraphosphatase (symmetrical) YqeK [Evansella halocellulosilytica]|uniref:bis(5'-nucleosyl)-tetraphosphatase (symmetrical) YqeK n=1 Tax=Evansella halocellulosilytica TaxID=2011013 RepID=UPI000BB7FBB0|nr:bis(5'-nucleosyl)-tetraphosphatase (symmetrical) YqeK [Evansella halocellulosilytica]